MDKQIFDNNEALEFDFLLQWEWPAHIEDSMRRMLFLSLLEACEPGSEKHKHTSFLHWQIATYPDSPPAVLDLLANMNEPSLVIRVAENPQTWGVTLTRLAQHKLSSVRLAVAERAFIPIGVMNILASDECPDVCYAMAENFNLPKRILRQLTAHDNPYVANRAERTLSRRTKKTTTQLPVTEKRTKKAE